MPQVIACSFSSNLQVAGARSLWIKPRTLLIDFLIRFHWIATWTHLIKAHVMDTREIAPCPFCGSPRVSCIEIDQSEWSVTCEGCKANGSSRPTYVQAIEAWQAVAEKAVCKEEPGSLLHKMLKKVP